MRPDLRTRLLALTLPVTLAAVVAAAWVTNRQTRQEVAHDITRERQKPQVVVETLRQVGQREQGWDDIEAAVTELARSNDLRIAVFSEDDVLLADSDPRAAVPATEPIVVEPVESEKTQVARHALAQQAYGQFMNCLIERNVPFTAAPDDGDGILKPKIEDRANVPDVRACNAIRQSLLDAAKQFGADEQTFQPVKVYLGPTRLESGTLLSSGVSRRLVLTLAAVAALTILLTAVAARRITRPLGTLTRAVRRMRNGHLDERVPEGRRDELGELSRAFNAMAASLAEGDRLRRRMTSDVAHELRTPLSNIRGYLEAAQDGVAPLTPELIESLLEDTLLLQALVDDLQELAVAESGQLRLERAPTDLDDLVASVAAAHQTRAAVAGIRLGVQTGLGAPADVDPRRIRQVLTNLVENAIRHTDSGGRIAISTRQVDGRAEIVVRDSGVGIPPEDLPHIFDRFYRADPSRHRATGGSGLGLAITRELVTAHGGQLDVVSTVGEGTAFTVRLPLTTAGADAAPSASTGAVTAGETRWRRGRARPASEARAAGNDDSGGNGFQDNGPGPDRSESGGNGNGRVDRRDGGRRGGGASRGGGTDLSVGGTALRGGTSTLVGGPGRAGGNGHTDPDEGGPAVVEAGGSDRRASTDVDGDVRNGDGRGGGHAGLHDGDRRDPGRGGAAHPPPPPPPPVPPLQRRQAPVDFTYIDVS